MESKQPAYEQMMKFVHLLASKEAAGGELNEQQRAILERCRENGILPYNEPSTDLFTKDDLLKAGFGLILDSPGIDRAEWAQAMIDCNAEIVDEVFGLDGDTLALLEDVWDCDDYEDPETGISLSMSDWSSFFSGNLAVDVYTRFRQIFASLITQPQSET